jgi:Pyruvate/2-oxoacid:ferredoxin oxidoreductase gamma subunit
VNSFLNAERPPVFCPGCTHERITHTLDHAFQDMGLAGHQIVIVSDIGCSGLFDTFFHTHAFHGLHGRALTYATGLKMARPELKVVVTMGDGGQGIGGAHLLAACRRNLDLTLLILNNFNFGMTGGQFSATTPPDAQLGSGFLNQLERPLDICEVARSAGAPYVRRCSGFRKNLAEEIQCAIEPPLEGIVAQNIRPEYGQQYRKIAATQKKVAKPAVIKAQYEAPQVGRHEVILLGSAGQRVITAGEILCIAGLTAGLKTTQKNEYNITVLRGPSISELILSPEEIDYTGIDMPSVVVALDQEGVDRRRGLFKHLAKDALVIQVSGVSIPASKARIHLVDLKNLGIKRADWALASLAVLPKLNRIMSAEMLKAALKLKFKRKNYQAALEIISRLGLN